MSRDPGKLKVFQLGGAAASEVRYLLRLSARLGLLQKADQAPLVRRYDDLRSY